MGYACPVCDDPQADAEHLANHLAFTAMLRGDGHETWLDDRVDDWDTLAPVELADHVAEHAEEEEFPQVFEDTTGGSHESGHGHDHGGPGGRGHGQGSHDRGHSGHGHGTGGHSQGGHPSGQSPGAIEDAVAGGVADLDDFEGDTDDVLAEARELTRARRENTADRADVESTDGEGGAGEDGAVKDADTDESDAEEAPVDDSDDETGSS